MSTLFISGFTWGKMFNWKIIRVYCLCVALSHFHLVSILKFTQNYKMLSTYIPSKCSYISITMYYIILVLLYSTSLTFSFLIKRFTYSILFQAFVDSGAQSTIISKSCAERCGYEIFLWMIMFCLPDKKLLVARIIVRLY